MKILRWRKEKQVAVEKAEVKKIDDQSTSKARNNTDNKKPVRVRSKLNLSRHQKDPVEKVAENDDASWWPKAEDDAATQYSSSSANPKDKDKQKQVVYTHFGDSPYDVMEVTMAPKPRVENSTDVLIKVEASTVTLNDCLVRRGICLSVWDPVCLPATPGADVVGTIEEMGKDVPVDWKISDRVAALVRMGGNARYIVVHHKSLIHVPRSLDAADAVSMVSTYMTAYQSLKLTLDSEEKRGAKPFAGRKILVVGGGTPVGQALIQLSVKAGATEVYATGPAIMTKYLKTMGAIPIGHEPYEWLPQVKGEMDLVFDGVCQDGYDSSQLALQEKGKLVAVGMVGKLQREGPGLFGAPLSAFMTDAKASLFMSKTQTYDAWSSFQHDPETYKADMEKLFTKLKKHQIRPQIARRVGLNNVVEAHLFIERDKARGLVVCLPWKRFTKKPKAGAAVVPADEAAPKENEIEKEEEKEARQDAIKPKRQKQRSFSSGIFREGRDKTEKRGEGRDKAEKRQNKNGDFM